MKTGIQVSSLKPLLTTPEQVRAAFERMAALGCGYVQLQWIDQAVPIGDIAAALEESGMKSLGTQDFYTAVEMNLEYYVNLNAATKGSWLTVSRIPERCKSREGLDIFAEELCALQEKLAPLGQKVCLHPVSADFAAVPGINGGIPAGKNPLAGTVPGSFSPGQKLRRYARFYPPVRRPDPHGAL